MENTEGTSRLEGRVIHVIFENEDTGYTVFEVESGVEYYEVAGVEVLKGTAVEEMQAGDWELTLFTCTIGGKARVTVRCTADNG